MKLMKKPIKITNMKKTDDIVIKEHNNVFRQSSKATDTKIIHLMTPNGKKVFKFSYENGNAFEHFKGEIFGDDKLNIVFILTDLGLKRNTSAYHLFTEQEFKMRVKELTDRGIKFIKNLY